VDRSHVFQLIDALAQGDGTTVVETSETLRVNGQSAASTLEEMTVVLQRMAVLQAVPDSADESDPEAAETARLAALLPADETQLLYSLCLHGRGELGLAPDEYAALTMVLLRLLAFKPGVAGSAEKKTLKSPETRAVASVPVARPAAPAAATSVSAPTPPVAVHPITAPALSPRVAPVHPTHGQVLSVVDAAHPTPPATPVPGAPVPAKVVAVPVRVAPESRADAPGPSAGSPLVPTEEGAYWHLTVQQLVASEAVTALVRELALQSQLVARDSDQWLLRVERESLNSTSSRERLQAALQAAGHGVTLAVEIGRVSDSPAKRNAAAAAEKQQAAEKLIYEDPFVQTMMRDFGAKIVPGSIKPIDTNA